MDKVRSKPNSSVQHTPSSESFQVQKQKDNACGIDGGTTLSSFKNIINMKTPQ
jgi:hypothetical protein